MYAGQNTIVISAAFQHNHEPMLKSSREAFIEQLKTVISAADDIIAGSEYSDLSDLDQKDLRLGISRLRAGIERASLQTSSYVRELDRIDSDGWQGGSGLAMYRGVAQALLQDLEAGYTLSVQEIVHAETFSDHLDMAQHLLDNDYKDAAAVIAGSTLEVHLRNLCRKHGLALDRTTSTGTAPKKADALNSDLAGAGVYGTLDQKSVTALLDLRNKAAHGQYVEYDAARVRIALDSIRHFLLRFPA